MDEINLPLFGLMVIGLMIVFIVVYIICKLLVTKTSLFIDNKSPKMTDGAEIPINKVDTEGIRFSL